MFTIFFQCSNFDLRIKLLNDYPVFKVQKLPNIIRIYILILLRVGLSSHLALQQLYTYLTL